MYSVRCILRSKKHEPFPPISREAGMRLEDSPFRLVRGLRVFVLEQGLLLRSTCVLRRREVAPGGPSRFA